MTSLRHHDDNGMDIFVIVGNWNLQYSKMLMKIKFLSAANTGTKNQYL